MSGAIFVLMPLVLISSSALVSLTLANKARRFANAISAITMVISLCLLLYVLSLCLISGSEFEAYSYVLNSATSLMSALLVFLGLLAVIYSFGYMDHEPRYDLYSSLLLIFILSMIYIVLASDISLIYLTFELGTAVGGVLITFNRRRSNLRAATRFLALNVLAAMLILTGLAVQYYYVGNLSIAAISELPVDVKELVLLIYTLGFSIKAGLVPFGLLWLPSAHSEAPVPVSALLSAALVQSAAFVLLRMYSVLTEVSSLLINTLIALGTLSLLIGALEALIEATGGSRYSRFHVGPVHICGIKRVWAFSTISEIGYIAIFLALYLSKSNADSAVILLGGALMHMINHGLAKAQLFFDTGVVIRISHAEDLNYMGGAWRTYSIGNATFWISCLSLGLVPGFAGYGTLRELSLNSYVPMYLRVMVIATALITLTAISISWYRAFLTNPKSELASLSSVPKTMLFPGPLLALLLIVIGVLYAYGSVGGTRVLEELAYELARSIEECK
ncbi:MAG: hypothetical protein J7L11_09440 [Thermoprotei archaeon]|nr:hypothetical protein [Thermoprotei archaeon]